MISKVLDLIYNPVAQTVIMALCGVIFAGFAKYKALVKEILDVPKKYRDSKKPDSNGGVETTEAEWAAIGKEIVEVIEAASKIDWKGIFTKLFKRS
jgi:hypothetical protein